MQEDCSNIGRGRGPDMVPRKNKDGTFTVLERSYIMRIGNTEILLRVNA